MIPQKRKLHCLTVHFGKPSLTKTLIEQLLHSSRTPDSITVIDHADQPFSWANRAGAVPVTIVRPEKNGGYAAGINLGLGVLVSKRAGKDDLVVALNNDVDVPVNALQIIAEYWEKQPKPKIAGLRLGYVHLFTGRSHLQPPPQKRPWHLPYVHGTLIAAPFHVLIALQGLPTFLFLYWEDVLFSWRAQQMRFALAQLPPTGIAHSGDFNLPHSDDHLYYLVRNGALFLARWSPRPWRVWWRVANPLRLVYHTLRHTNPVIREGLRDALRQRTGKRP